MEVWIFCLIFGIYVLIKSPSNILSSVWSTVNEKMLCILFNYQCEINMVPKDVLQMDILKSFTVFGLNILNIYVQVNKAVNTSE